jgi:hypothetical protein
MASRRASAARAVFFGYEIYFGFVEDLLHLHIEVFYDFAGEFEMALMCGGLWRFARWFFFLELSKVLGMTHLVWNLTSWCYRISCSWRRHRRHVGCMQSGQHASPR